MARTARSEESRDTVIGRTTQVRGRLVGEGSLLVEGSVEGDIGLVGDLTVAEGARAVSNVEAHAVTIRGELTGDIQASGVVRIDASARVQGDIEGELVTIEDGAEFVGRLDVAFDLPPELEGGRRR